MVPTLLKKERYIFMFKTIVKRFTWLMILLFLVPLLAWIFQWHWAADLTYSSWDYPLYLLTETGSAPYFALIFSLFLGLVLVLLCQNKHHSLLLLFLATFTLHAGTQIIKSSIKQLFQEPRPYMDYIVELADGELDNLESFYANSRKSRGEIIYFLTQKDTHTPSYVLNHWASETGYSFPSGHSLFATCWLFLFIGFLTREKNKHTVLIGALMTLWTLLMLISRLRFGMHYPLDLFASIVLAYLANLGLFFYLEKRAQPPLP